MMSLSDRQLALLSSRVEDLFVVRVKDAIESDYPELLAGIQDEQDNQTLWSLIKIAKTHHIEIEQDVFDFIILNLTHGIEFYEDAKYGVDGKWLLSEFVPGIIKIQKLQASVNLA